MRSELIALVKASLDECDPIEITAARTLDCPKIDLSLTVYTGAYVPIHVEGTDKDGSKFKLPFFFQEIDKAVAMFLAKRKELADG